MYSAHRLQHLLVSPALLGDLYCFINRIRLTQETVYGKDMKLDNLDKVIGVIIRLRSNENVEISKNQLIAMLEELLKKDEISRKKEKLSNKYGLIMNDNTERRLGDMCNLSDLLVQESKAEGKAEGRAEGRAEGINEGRSEEKTAIARNMLTKGYDLKTVSELTGLSTDEVLALK